MPGVPRKSLPDALGAYRGGKPCLHVAATARPAKAETGTRQATAVKIRREKNRTITTVRFFCFPSIDRRMVVAGWAVTLLRGILMGQAEYRLCVETKMRCGIKSIRKEKS